MSQSYTYSALPDPVTIRIIILQPGHEGEPIECHIQHASMDSNPVYHALSYTWGLDRPLGPSEPPSYQISLAGKSFDVAPNLFFALRRWRHVTQPQSLWVDAVCINQNDNAEKSHQVQMMGEIYSEAQCVIIWLGEEEPLDANAEAMVNRFIDVEEPWTPSSIFEYKTKDMKFDKLGWEGMASLLRRRWFRRVWVLQEVVMAKLAVFLFGPRHLPFHSLAHVYKTIAKFGIGNEFQLPSGLASGTLLTKSLQLMEILSSGQKVDFLNAIGVTSTLEATDPRDKIYAVLAFLQEEDLLQADYRISGDELLQNINVSLASKQDLRFLSFFDANSVQSPCKLSPWGPNWIDVELDREAFASWGRYIEYGPSGTANAEVSPDGLRLTLRGIILDEVRQRGCTFQRSRQPVPIANTAIGPYDLLNRFTENMSRFGKYLASCQRVARAADPAVHPGQDALEALWRTLMCNLDVECRTPATNMGSVFRAFAQSLFLCDEWRQAQTPTNRSLLPPQVIQLCQQGAPFESVALNKAAPGRRFCNTKKGYLGMVPALAKKSDRICFFLGGMTPFVIRSKSDGVYQLIGECYLHGMMNGETLRLTNFEARLEDITLG